MLEVLVGWGELQPYASVQGRSFHDHDPNLITFLFLACRSWTLNLLASRSLSESNMSSKKTKHGKRAQDYKGLPIEFLTAHSEAMRSKMERDIAAAVKAGPIMRDRLLRYSETRAQYKDLIDKVYNATFLDDGDRNASIRLEEGLRMGQGFPEDQIMLFRGWFWKQHGSNLFAAGDLAGARASFKRALRGFLGVPVDHENYVLPSPTAVNVPVSRAEIHNFAEAAMCANNIAQCYIKEGNQVAVSLTVHLRFT